MSINIIGISALYHDSACCILKDGKIIAAAQEERFTRIKADNFMPYHAFKYCLQKAGLSITDVNCVAYYELPEMKLARQIWSGYDFKDKDYTEKMDPWRSEREIREILGYEGPIEYVEHHISHAASSFYYSGIPEAAIMTVDGVGEWNTTTYGVGKENRIELFDRVDFPDSIGLFYAALTAFLGFRVNSGEYKVMGMAPYGDPLYVDQLKKMISYKGNGKFELNMEYYDFIRGEKMYSEKLIELLGIPPRVPESELSKCYKDVACSLQVVTEEILVQIADYIYKKTKCKHLCMAGGVALNCVANGSILKRTLFEDIFVQPAAGDAGGCLGAAAEVYLRMTNRTGKIEPINQVYYGEEYSDEIIKNLLDTTSMKYEDYSEKKEELLVRTAELMSEGYVIGWFQGRMEFGPRALGSRSIIADPRGTDMRDRINSMVKKREAFRPFAPSVLESKMREHFELDTESPYMLLVCQVHSPLDLPAITHVNGSARVQSVKQETNALYHDLIQAFDKQTGCPIILNTSFNVRGEPIVMTPVDALACFINTKIDCLVIGNFIIQRKQNSFTLMKLLVGNTNKANTSIDGRRYTFI